MYKNPNALLSTRKEIATGRLYPSVIYPQVYPTLASLPSHTQTDVYIQRKQIKHSPEIQDKIEESSYKFLNSCPNKDP